MVSQYSRHSTMTAHTNKRSRWTVVCRKLLTTPQIAHLLRTIFRFNERMGSQFGAAITYFSFLSIIPLFMIAFAVGGFILASQPALLQLLTDKIIHIVSEPTLAATLEKTVNTAVQQRTVVGVSGLLLALYSGINWMGNLREAIQAQMRPEWRKPANAQHSILKVYFYDLLYLFLLGIALVVTFAFTSLIAATQSWLVDVLSLSKIQWLFWPIKIITLSISILTNYLMFLWIFWVLPKEKPARRPLLKGALMAAIGFETIKYAMTLLVPALVKSPSGAAFGSIIGLLAFFYIFARLTLFCAAWIATARIKPLR